MIFPVELHDGTHVYLAAESYTAAKLWAATTGFKSRPILASIDKAPDGATVIDVPAPQSYESRALEYRNHIVLDCAARLRDAGWTLAAMLLEEGL
jgi:hypothetical protein